VSTPYPGGTPGAPAPPYGEPGLGQGGATSYTPAGSGPQYAYGDPDQPLTDDGHPDVEGTSVGELIGEVTRDLSTLMRQELELAKAEVREEATKAGNEVKAQASKAGKGAGMLGGAGYAGHMTALFLSVALWWALSHVVGHSWSALIVAVLWGIIAAVLYSMGRKQLKQVDFSGLKQVNPKPERTVETLQQVPGALKPN
jgi:Putative Actinobacterial Holin-X, holin superfamily III